MSRTPLPSRNYGISTHTPSFYTMACYVYSTLISPECHRRRGQARTLLCHIGIGMLERKAIMPKHRWAWNEVGTRPFLSLSKKALTSSAPFSTSLLVSNGLSRQSRLVNNLSERYSYVLASTDLSPWHNVVHELTVVDERRNPPISMLLQSPLFASSRFRSNNVSTKEETLENIGKIIIKNNDINNSNGEVDLKRGEECYERAMEALKNASRAKELYEERLAREQYEAMDRQRQRKQQRAQQLLNVRQQNSNHHCDDHQQQQPSETKPNDREDSRDRAAGIAVIRTIVKQSQPKAVQVHQWSSGNRSNSDTHKITNNIISSKNGENVIENDRDEHYWQRIAHAHMEEASDTVTLWRWFDWEMRHWNVPSMIGPPPHRHRCRLLIRIDAGNGSKNHL